MLFYVGGNVSNCSESLLCVGGFPINAKENRFFLFDNFQI